MITKNMLSSYSHINRLYNNNKFFFKNSFSFSYLVLLNYFLFLNQGFAQKDSLTWKEMELDSNVVKTDTLIEKKWDEVLKEQGAEWKVYEYANGKKSSEGYELNGKPEGAWKTYYENGVMASVGFRTHHLLSGPWNFYRKDGSLKKVINYEANVKQGWEQNFNSAEVLTDQTYFKSGVKDSIAYRYFLDGSIKEINYYQNNDLNGYQLLFDSAGQYITTWSLFKNNVNKFELNINRRDAQGKKTGKWYEFFPITDLTYQSLKTKKEIDYKQGLYHGIYKEFDKYGKIIVFKRYVNGEEVLEDDLTGVAVTDREYYSNGQLSAVGAYKKGKKNGIWAYFKEDGEPKESILYHFDTIVGSGQLTKAGQKNGWWKLYFEDGALESEGEYVDGRPHGLWKYYFKNGKINQTGNFKNGLKNGTWIWYYPNGEIRLEEDYLDDLQDGLFVEYDSLGTIKAKGEFIEGYKSGNWEITVNGHLYKGKFADDHRNGEWIGYWHGKDLYFKGSFAAGKPEGKHFYYHENGRLAKKEYYTSGFKNGKFIEYNENKEIVNILKFKNGVLEKINGTKVKNFDVEQPKEIRDPFEDYE